MSIEKIKIVKLFASDEYKTRNMAYKTIVKLMKFNFGDGQRQLNKNEVISIWKGLYVWLWMQDKPLLHEEVVGKICNLLNLIKCDELAIQFIDAFFITMMREWRKIDVHRMDKFYMLTRDFFATCLIWLKSKENSDSFVAIFLTKVINGVMDQGIEFRLHVIDILLDELVRAQSSTTLTTDIVLGCIRSMITISQKHAYVIKMRKRVIDRIVPLYVESKLQIDLERISTVCLAMAQKEEMFGKMRKLCYYLSNRFIKCKKNDSVELPNNEADIDGGHVQGDQDDGHVQDAMEVHADKKEDVEEEKTLDEVVDTNEADAEVESDMEVDGPVLKEDDTELVNEAVNAEVAESSEQSTDDEAAVMTPVVHKVTKKSQKVKTKKLSVDKKSSTTAADVCSKDRKVTFGKKYIKKFKKTDVNVAISQGTVKNSQVRSILKKT